MKREYLNVNVSLTTNELEEYLSQLDNESLVQIIQSAAELLIDSNRKGRREIKFDTEVHVLMREPREFEDYEKEDFAIEYLKEQDIIGISLPSNLTGRMEVMQVLDGLDLLKGALNAD